jgi:hypothetical protein
MDRLSVIIIVMKGDSSAPSSSLCPKQAEDFNKDKKGKADAQSQAGSAIYRPSVRTDGLKPAPNSVCAKRPSVNSNC